MGIGTRTWLVVVTLLLAAERPSFAQVFTVQQPAVGTMSVGTTVSVPDRGSLYLGGVSRAGAVRRSFGPFRSGTSTGVFREHAGLRVAVQIHDFETMDRALLAAPVAVESHRSTKAVGIAPNIIPSQVAPRRATGRAAQAYRTLVESHRLKAAAHR